MKASRHRPYGLLAKHYEAIVPGAAQMNRHARKRALGPILERARSVCDLACGPGHAALELARASKRVFAVDLAPHFCDLVRKRARAAKLDVTVIRADMRRFRLPEQVDLVLCEFSAVNNLTDRRGLASVFRSVACALEPGGHFLVDVNTPKSFATQVAVTSWLEARDFKLVLQGKLEDKGRRAVLTCDWFEQNGKLWRHERETIVNVCWTDREIRDALESAGLRVVKKLDGVDIRPLMQGAVRGTDEYYLAQKPRRAR